MTARTAVADHSKLCCRGRAAGEAIPLNFSFWKIFVLSVKIFFQKVGLKIPISGEFMGKLKIWTPPISCVGDLQLSVGKLQYPAGPAPQLFLTHDVADRLSATAGNIRELTTSEECQVKSCHGKLFFVNLTFQSSPVFNRSYAIVYIMHFCSGLNLLRYYYTVYIVLYLAITLSV